MVQARSSAFDICIYIERFSECKWHASVLQLPSPMRHVTGQRVKSQELDKAKKIFRVPYGHGDNRKGLSDGEDRNEWIRVFECREQDEDICALLRL